MKLHVLLLLVILQLTYVADAICKQPFKQNSVIGEATMSENQMTLEIFNQPDVMLKEKTIIDLSAFRKHKGEEISDSYRFTRPDGVVVTLQESGDKVNQYLTLPGSPFEYVNIYDLHGNLKYKATRFYAILIGDQIELNQNGTIKEKVNLYGNHKITVGKLREIIKNELNKDIYDPNQTNDVLSGDMEDQPFYEIRLYNTDSSSPQLVIYLVDGNTGEILFNIPGVRYLLDAPRGKNKPKNIVDEYQKHLKEIEQQGKKDN